MATINDPVTPTNVAAVKAASTAPQATDMAMVVAISPNSPVLPISGTVTANTGLVQAVTDAQARAFAATLAVTATAAVNTASTCTLPAAGVGLFHYITSIKLQKLYSVVGVASGSGVVITTTNLPGSVAWTTEQLASPAGTVATVLSEQLELPLKSSGANTATTFVAPAQLQTIWRWVVTYYTA